jgi:hypothetical protein
MGDDTAEREPGTGIYILAWILAKVAATVTSNVIVFFAFGNTDTADDFMNRIMLIMPFSIVLVAAAMIGAYSFFPGLQMVKVIPYLWGLGALGVIITFVQTASSGIPYPILYYGLVLVEFVLTMLGLIWGFRRIGRL